MSVIVEDGKIRLSGYVGDYYYEDGFTSSDIVLALADIEDADDLTVFLNSGGGIATEGAAIHALLSARRGRTDIVIEGIAASAASLIAMAGQTVTMAAGAVMMIHDPSGLTAGTSRDHAKTIEGLEALATAYARIYAAKSGKTPAECRAIMQDERWFTPEQAVAEGFADKMLDAAGPAMIAAFDYRAYRHAPVRLTALAATKNWTAGGSPSPSPDPSQPPVGEKARMKAIMTSPEAMGREDLAEHLTFETGLTAVEAIAVLGKSPQAAGRNDEFIAQYEAMRQGRPVERAAGAGVAHSVTSMRPPVGDQDFNLANNMRRLVKDMKEER